MRPQTRGFDSFVAQPGEEVFPKSLISLHCDAQLTALLTQDVLWAMGGAEKTSHQPPYSQPPNLLCSCPSKPWTNACATLGVWGRVCFDVPKPCIRTRRKDSLNIYRLETNQNGRAACTACTCGRALPHTASRSHQSAPSVDKGPGPP